MNYDQFIYTDLRVDSDRHSVLFGYQLHHNGRVYTLSEKLEFPLELKDTPEQHRSLRALHLALGVSYYKVFLPPTILHPYSMDMQEAEFWNDIWLNGLGDFLYSNNVNPKRLASFSEQSGLKFEGNNTVENTNGALLGIGGGKDSIVAGELLKDLNIPANGFVMATGEQLGQAGQVAQAMGINLFAIKRQLDKQLLELNKLPGALNGHIPISLIFGLVGTALAIANGSAYVVVANEASASIPRVRWKGRAINHQWSKSFEFEQDLQGFVHKYICQDVTYFSAIRPLTSIAVAKLFSNYPKYFEIFTSDNFVFRIDPSRRPSGRWSLESPKSLSSYLLLAPWLSDDDVHRMFTKDFLNEQSLSKLFLELTGVKGEPPLDCVGTVEELVLSVNLLAEAGRYSDTVLMKLARENGIIRKEDWLQKQKMLLKLQKGEAFPPELHDSLSRRLQERADA